MLLPDVILLIKKRPPPPPPKMADVATEEKVNVYKSIYAVHSLKDLVLIAWYSVSMCI